jgi:hypothetical protein
MPPDAKTNVASEDRQWFIVGRWQEYEGESRANLFRIAAVGLFYGIELGNYWAGAVDRPFHQAVTGRPRPVDSHPRTGRRAEEPSGRCLLAVGRTSLAAIQPAVGLVYIRRINFVLYVPAGLRQVVYDT